MKKSYKILIVIIVVIIIVVIGALAYSSSKKGASQAAPQGTASTTNDYVMKNGSEVDPTLAAAIIQGYEAEKKLFSTGTVAQVRQYIIDGTPASSSAEVATEMKSVPDSEIESVIANYNQLFGIININNLTSSSTSWMFTPDLQKVQITEPIASTTIGSTTVTHLTIDMVYNNGQWY